MAEHFQNWKNLNSGSANIFANLDFKATQWSTYGVLEIVQYINVNILKKLLCSITFCCGHQQKGWSGSVSFQNKSCIAIFFAIKITHPWLQVMQPVPLIIFIHAQDKLTFHSFIICYIFYFHSTSIFRKGTDLFISCNEGLILSRRKSKLGALIKTK